MIKGGLPKWQYEKNLAITVIFKDGEQRPWVKQYGWPLEPEKDKDTDYPLEPPESNKALLTTMKIYIVMAIYAPSMKTPKYRNKQILTELEGEIAIQ